MVPRCAVRVAVLAAVFVGAGAVNSSAGTEHDATRAGAVRHGSAPHRKCSNAGLMPAAENLKLIRRATLCLINRERARHGERPLRANARLRRAAQAHSESMAFDDYFEHVGPRGQTPLARMRAVGYVSRRELSFEVGENIAWGTLSLATPRAIVATWMASPGHRANILDPRYRETGIGVSPHPLSSRAHGQPGAIYTQDFGVVKPS
jgi:uncharacterized protein YkwD